MFLEEWFAAIEKIINQGWKAVNGRYARIISLANAAKDVALMLSMCEQQGIAYLISRHAVLSDITCIALETL